MWEFYAPRQGNTAAISKNHITLPLQMIGKLNTNHVGLAYDRDNNQILVKAQNEGLKISNRKVLARQFLNHFELSIKGNYQCNYSEEDNGVIIALS